MTYSFDIDVAKEYGVNEAILIANLQFWIRKNRANDKNFYDGRYWTYNSIKAWQELFPFWTEKTIRTIINHLIEKGVIITGNYNQSKYDRTLWYAFADESIWLDGQIHLPKRENGNAEKGKPIPDNKPDNKPDSIYTHATAKKSYGEFGKVKLTDPEYAKLKESYGKDLDVAIGILDDYLASKGKKYASHYAVMKKNGWVWTETMKQSVSEDIFNII